MLSHLIMRKCNIACEMQAFIYCVCEKIKGRINLVKVFNKIVLIDERTPSFLCVYAGYSKWSYVGHTSNTPYIIMKAIKHTHLLF